MHAEAGEIAQSIVFLTERRNSEDVFAGACRGVQPIARCEVVSSSLEHDVALGVGAGTFLVDSTSSVSSLIYYLRPDAAPSLHLRRIKHFFPCEIDSLRPDNLRPLPNVQCGDETELWKG